MSLQPGLLIFVPKLMGTSGKNTLVGVLSFGKVTLGLTHETDILFDPGSLGVKSWVS